MSRRHFVWTIDWHWYRLLWKPIYEHLVYRGTGQAWRFGPLTIRHMRPR